MKTCIYCREQKTDSEFTLEHVIPQFMGGAYAPDYFKVRNVCKRCNSNLGLFVDAGFEKNWLVSNTLSSAAYAFFDPENPVGLPLICMGKSDLVPPKLQEGEICESWIGPLGEQIYWVRPHDDRLHWYSGGNPRTVKTIDTRAYFFFSERSPKNPIITWLSFRDAFTGRRVKKVMCTEIEGADSSEIGFEDPDELDRHRISFFNEACFTTNTRLNSVYFYTHFDFRFLAKLGIGVAYSLFGIKALQTEYAKELYKALWYREGEPLPEINGTSPLLHGSDPVLSNWLCEDNAVTITISPFPEGILVNLSLGGTLSWHVMCASLDGLTDDDIGSLQDGRVIVLYRQLQRGIEIPLLAYIAHKCGNLPHPVLTEISNQSASHRDYFKNL